MDAQSTAASDDVVGQLRAQLSATENRVAQLQQEKLEMEADFEHKRTKIKELYFAKETALREHNLRLLEAGRQISSMESTISNLREEVENVKMIAAVSENTKEEAVKDLDKHHQEEIESLRCVLQDSMEEQRKELVAQFDQERRRWEQEKVGLENFIKKEREIHSKLLVSPQGNREMEMTLKKQESELSMKKAQFEAETLKAVVLPFETEIAELKEKLKLTTELLEEKTIKQEYEVIGDKIDMQAKGMLPNGTEDGIIGSIKNNKGATTLSLNTPSDDGSFTQFQSYSSNNARPSPTQDSVSTTLTEFQDTISISSVSSMPSSTGLIPDEQFKSQRVLSAPHLTQLGDDHPVEKHKEPKVPADSSKPNKLAHVDIKFSDSSVSHKQVADDKLPEAGLEKALEKEKTMRLQVEEAVAHASEEAQKQINDLKKKLSDLESRLEDDKSWRRSKETEDDKRLTLLQKDRDNVYAEFLQTKKENDRLKSFHEKHRIDLSKEPVLPSNLEGLTSQVRKHRDAVLAARVEKSDIESRLQSQLSFLQDRLTAEQVAKEQLESTLLSELDQVKKELTAFHEVQAKLTKERSAKRDLVAQAEKDQILMASFRIKSNETNKRLEERLQAEISIKEELDSKLLAARNQISSLQEVLATSEQVQQDFVRLSQSLQMELEERRQHDRTDTESSPHSPAHPEQDTVLANPDTSHDQPTPSNPD